MSKKGQPRRDPLMHYDITVPDLLWAAGFLEGEGTFQHNTSTQRLGAYQVNREPLDRLVGIFGGRLYERPRRGIHEWYVTGGRARAAMLLLRPHMSMKRQAQIDRAIAPKPGQLRLEIVS